MSFWQFWEKYGRFGALGIGVGLIILGLVFGFDKREKASDVEFFETTKEQSEESQEIMVDIAGAVDKPGVYKLKSESRISQAVESAGGLSEEADQEWINRNLNLARKLTDGEKIYIPKKGESAPPSAELGEVAGVVAGKININLASEAELKSLPGIGSGFAQRIIEYRQAHGGFKTIEEIMAVSGIGKKTFEKIKEKVAI